LALGDVPETLAFDSLAPQTEGVDGQSKAKDRDPIEVGYVSLLRIYPERREKKLSCPFAG